MVRDPTHGEGSAISGVVYPGTTSPGITRALPHIWTLAREHVYQIPYKGLARDYSGRIIDLPQYRPMGISDLDSYPDYFWQKFGHAGHDPTSKGYYKALSNYIQANRGKPIDSYDC